MNNGKVRIYDLSKELNLDNKDILGICDQLNIAVKSHSSTISESEAERIRTKAAEKQSAQPVTKRGVSGNGAVGERKPNAPLPQPNRANVVHKPQILEIKHQSGSGTTSGGNSNQSGGVGPRPPSPPNKQQSATPMKPTTLNRPVRASEQPGMPLSQAEAEESVGLSQVIEDYSDGVETLQTAEHEQPLQAVIDPPVRPVSQPSGETQNQQSGQTSVTVDRPVLKKAKVEPANREAVKSPQPRELKPSAKPVAKKPNQLQPTLGAKPQAAPGQSLPELQKPQRKVKSAVGELQKPVVGRREPLGGRDRDLALGGKLETDENDKDLSLDGEAPDLELRRPTPPRLVKARKEWENEEDDDPDNPKAGKAGAKVKRRVAIVDEDDDDFVTDLEDLPETVTVSLSVARPPKPKNRPAGPAVAGAALAIGANRNKKAAIRSSSDTAQAKDNSRRRDQKTTVERPEKIVLTGSMTVRELATSLDVAETEIIKKLFFKGMAVNITQTLDIPTATMVAQEMGVEVETQEEQSEAIKVTEMLDVGDMENLHRRPPVVTIMGHVDHGKTTLLDAIRATKVAQGEAGGITQHIGAYHVDVEHAGKQEQIVFLDTPGHEAFTAMRARGARVTDIAVLVVAADDGVQPQTVEAISHAKAAEVPIVVAINKVDKAEAQPDRVKQELTEYGLVAEEWGGDTIMVPVSAIQKENLDTLLEMILLVAEVGELQANPNRPAKGTVIEAHLDKAKGPVATLLVQNGTLRVGDTLVAGPVLGKVRAMVDDRGKRVESAGPSWPVEVLGLSDVPAAGDEFDVFVNEKEARALASTRSDQQRQSRLQQVMASRRVTLNTLSQQAKEGELKELNLILKADVQGSVEAILGALRQLPQNEVQIRVLLTAAGEVTETDVDLAAASGAVIVGFNTTLASGARQAADEASVDVREYNIIYKLLDDIQGAMEGLLEPEQVEETLGQVEVRAIFPVGRGFIAGCYVLSGKVIRNCRVRVRRGNKVVYEGGLDSLKRMKEDVKEVNAGFECGIGIDRFNDWAESDIIEAYQMVSKRRTLSPN